MAKDLNSILLSAIEENKIKEKTPDKLPLNPTAEGWSGHEVRRFLAKSLIDSEGSFLAEFKKKMIEIKAQFEDIFGQGNGDIQGQIDIIVQKIDSIGLDEIFALEETVLNNYNTLNDIKVDKTLTILDIDLQDNITLAEFKTALGDATDLANGLMSALDKENLAQTMIDIQSLFSEKADKTTTIIGLDLQDNILLGEFRTALGNATQNVAGLFSAEDKTHLDGLVALLETDDQNNVVDTIGEILAIFEEYPEGADLVSALQGKVDKVEGKGLSTNDFTDDYKDKVDNQLTIEDFPTSMTPTAHTHTISEITDFPTSIAPAEHNHDDRYYTETEIDTKLAGIATTAHNHDDRYYTETEIDTKLAGKQDKLVAGANITIDENTNEISASGSGSYDDLTDKPYIPTKVSDLTNDTGYITDYTETDPIFTAWDKSTGISITKSQVSDFAHNHDDRYYTEGETDTLLNAKQNALGFTPENVANKKTTLSDSDVDYPTSKAVKTAIETAVSQTLKPMGNWNANTNTPTLTNTNTNRANEMYYVSVAGTQFDIEFDVGDELVYNTNGVIFKRDNVDAVVSVNTKKGVVVLNQDDISDGSTYKRVTTAEKNTWNNKVDKNANITAGTHPKITYDAKGLVTGGGALAASDIPNLAASKINSGTFDAARIPNLAASKISSGTFDAARIPNLSPSKITQDASNRFVIDAEKAYWDGKQDKLLAGANITIDPDTNVISASGGGGGGEYELTKSEIDTALVGSGTLSIQLGPGASALGDYSVALGRSASASEDYSTALGREASASGVSSTALGRDASASAPSSTALGQSASAEHNGSTALGQGARAEGHSSTALGRGSRAVGSFSIALGYNAKAEGFNSIAIGTETVVTEDNVVDFGSGSQVRVKLTPVNDRDAVSKKYLEDVIGSSVGQDIEDIKDGTTVVKKAEQDEDGNNIKDTYATVTYVDGKISGVFRPSGNWNANTNTPTLANNEPTNVGKVYYVTNAGTQFGLTFAVGDKLAFVDGGVATKWDNVDDVTSVNGKVGAVVLNQDDISDGSTYKRVTTAEKNTWNNKQNKLVAGTRITIDENNVISAEGGGDVDPNVLAYFDYAGSIYGVKYNLLPSAWEHSLLVDPSEISVNSTSSNSRGKAQYPNGEAEGVIIPQSVISIGNYAFGDWSYNNQPLVIPNSVTTIGNYAFRNWTSNNQPLVIPNGVGTIGAWAFSGWSSNNQPLVIPNGVGTIGDYAFGAWTENNQPLTIPNSVTSIGDYAFGAWSSAKEFIMESETPPTITINSFYNTNNAPIYVPDGSVTAYKTAPNWSALASRIFPISDKDNNYTKKEIDLMIGDIESALDAILGV